MKKIPPTPLPFFALLPKINRNSLFINAHIISIIFIIFVFFGTRAHAILDSNFNGVSDFWEIAHFDRLLPEETDLTADEDSDGWDLLEESTAGTSPFNGQSPSGFVIPGISRIPAISEDLDDDGIDEIIEPESVALTWHGIAGKSYHIICSPDLTEESWGMAVSSIQGVSGEMRQVIPLPDQDGNIPPAMFFRIIVTDTDSDGDGLTNTEEIAFGSDPFTRYSDGDDLTDEEEAIHGMDPRSKDSDGNSIPDHLEKSVAGFANKGVEYAPEYSWINLSRTLGYSFVSRGEPSPSHGGSISVAASWDPRLNYYGELGASIPIDRIRDYLASNIPFPADMPPYRPSAARTVWSSAYYSKPNDPDRSETATTTEMQMRLVSSHGTDHEIRRSILMVEQAQEVEFPAALKVLTGVVPQGTRSSPPEIVGDKTPITSGWTTRMDLYEAEFKLQGRFDPEDGWDTTEAEQTRAVAVGSSIPATLDCLAPWEIKKNQLEIVAAAGDESGIGIRNLVWTTGGAEFEIEGKKEGTYHVVLRIKADPSAIIASMTVHVFKHIILPVAVFRVWDSRNPETLFANDPQPSIADILTECSDTFKKQGMVTFVRDIRSRDIDLAKEPGAPEWFNQNGGFHFENKQAAADEYLTSITENDLIFVFIVKRLEHRPRAGIIRALALTKAEDLFIAVDSRSKVEVYSHEMGHALGLATKSTARDFHDSGPFPSWWKEKRYVGRMIANAGDNETRWIRSTDWLEANSKANEIIKNFSDPNK